MTETPEQKPPIEKPEANLTTLILNLAATALAYLGTPLTPDAKPSEPNFALARYTIDTLIVIKEKTTGNRTPEETELLEETITQLQLLYIQKTQISPSQNPNITK